MSPALAGSAAVIMAAGKSTRMKSDVPKALHKICGKEITQIVVDACRDAGISRVIVVVGHEAERVRQGLGPDVEYVEQTEQKGTGHAVMQAAHLLEEVTGSVVILPGDAPLIRAETLRDLLERHNSTGAAATLLTAEIDDPGSYGRILRFADQRVDRIVEARDAAPDQILIKEVASSMYAFKPKPLLKSLRNLTPENAQKEYYLTDVIGMLSSSGELVDALIAKDSTEILGINTRVELAAAAAAMRHRILLELMLSGVTVVDPITTYVDLDVSIGRDTIIHPCTVIETGSRVGANCSIRPFVRLAGTTVGNNFDVTSATASQT